MGRTLLGESYWEGFTGRGFSGGGLYWRALYWGGFSEIDR